MVLVPTISRSLKKWRKSSSKVLGVLPGRFLQSNRKDGRSFTFAQGELRNAMTWALEAALFTNPLSTLVGTDVKSDFFLLDLRSRNWIHIFRKNGCGFVWLMLTGWIAEAHDVGAAEHRYLMRVLAIFLLWLIYPFNQKIIHPNKY